MWHEGDLRVIHVTRRLILWGCGSNWDSMGRVRSDVVLAGVLAVVAVAALAVRLSHLSERPFHGDEANQAYRFGVLLETGEYAYDPHEHHGPTLYYATLPVAWVLGQHTFADTADRTYRLVPIVFGAALVLILILYRRGLSIGALLWAALFTTLSHAMVFYSRYYIQEMMLVFFTALAIGAGWRYYLRPSVPWAIIAGIALGLMHATKETCILAYAAMAGGIAVAWCYRAKAPTSQAPLPLVKHAAVLVVAALIVSITFFSSFFTHWRGPLDSILTYTHYLARSEGAGSAAVHDHPWHFYLATLLYTKKAPGPWWSEALILGLAAVGFVVALWPRKDKPLLLPFLAVYTLLLTIVYSLIAYKTPWSMLSFFHGMILLAGVGAAALVRAMRWKPLQAAMALAILAGAAQLAQQTYKGMTVYAADPRNPYVYAHTAPTLVRLTDRIHDIACFAPEGNAMRVDIIAPDGDYWPLPYYLRDMPHVGYWPTIPDPLEAPVFVTPTALHEEIAARVGDTYHMEFYALRPGVLRLLYIRNDLWEAFLATRS